MHPVLIIRDEGIVAIHRKVDIAMMMRPLSTGPTVTQTCCKGRSMDITEVEQDRATIYELRVDPSDVGQVIGRSGKTVNAIRTLLQAGSAKGGKFSRLEIIDEKEDNIGLPGLGRGQHSHKAKQTDRKNMTHHRQAPNWNRKPPLGQAQKRSGDIPVP